MLKKIFLQKDQARAYDDQSRDYSQYWQKIEPHILESFNLEQLQAITQLLNQAIPQSSPKIVDFRFVVDLVFSRFYVVLLVGKDSRKQQRQYEAKGIARVGNLIAAVFLLLGINLVISALILLFAYLIKSAIGINFFPGHISETLSRFLHIGG